LCFRETKLETAGSSVAVAAVAMCPPCGRKGYLGLERSYSRGMRNSRLFVSRSLGSGPRPVARDSWRRSGEPEEVFLFRVENVFSFVVRKLRRFLNVGLFRVGLGADARRQGSREARKSRNGAGARKKPHLLNSGFASRSVGTNPETRGLLLFFVFAPVALIASEKYPPTPTVIRMTSD